jgi:hypothetical protein
MASKLDKLKQYGFELLVCSLLFPEEKKSLQLVYVAAAFYRLSFFLFFLSPFPSDFEETLVENRGSCSSAVVGL